MSPASASPRRPLVFITGASSGIGQALAWRFYQAGYALALVGRHADAIESWLGPRGISKDCYEIYSADVTIIDSIVAAGQACLVRQGVPDVVIANAGISLGVDTTIRSDLDVIARIYATNTIGVAATLHPFLAAMVARGSGTVVGIGSVGGIRGMPGHGAYNASKAAVISYLESLRGELRGTGVRAVTVVPGYVDTPLTRQNRYSMPFLMSSEVFADRAFDAIVAGTSYRVIPWQMGVVAKLLRLLPNWLFDRLLQGRPRKHRSPDA